MKNTVACVHAHISRRRNRLLVRLSCAGRVLWRSYPLDMPEDEAVMLAVKRLFPLPPPGQQIDAEILTEKFNGEKDDRHPCRYRKGKDEQDNGASYEKEESALTHRASPPLRVAWWTRLQEKV